MLAKLTSKNQITIPKKIIAQLGEIRYFEVALQEGVIVLRPLKTYYTDLDKIHSKVAKLKLTPDSVSEAVNWARSKSPRS
jgi:bifunctional DNA-binding transcriptional regulator/antitoxin component of YhaV-PrlF toxin-antitoxin module